MSLRVPGGSAVVFFAVLLLVGCAPTSDDQRSDLRARLDIAAGEIQLPLEQYAMSQAEQNRLSQANAILVSQCMAESGREFPAASMDWSAATTFPDRRYGLWSMTEAESNGYEVPETKESARVSAEEERFDDAWWQAVYRCYDQVDLLPLMGVNTNPGFESPVDRGMTESFNALLGSGEFASARTQWRECIEAQGVAPDEGASVLVPQFPAPGEQQIRVATIDAACKDQLNTVQTLADFEAARQSSYVDQHEAELLEYRRQVDDVLAIAQAVVSGSREGSG